MLRKRTLLAAAAIGLSAATYAQTWHQVNGPSAGIVHYVKRSGNLFYAATSRGLFKSSDTAKSWQPDTAVIKPDWAVRALVTKGDTIIASSDNGTFTSHNRGLSWTQATYQGTAVPVMYRIVHNGNLFLAQLDGNAEALSSTDGLNWDSEGVSLDVGASGKSLFRTGGVELFRSDDNASTWNQVNQRANGFDHISGNGQYLFCGSGPDGLLRSADSGKTFTPVTNGLPAGQLFVESIIFDGNMMYASLLGANAREVYFAGVTTQVWAKRAAANSMKTWGTDLYVDQNIMLAAGQTGVHRSTDKGQHWELRTANGINTASVSDILQKGNDLYVAISEAHGLYQSPDMGSSFYVSDSDMSLSNGDNRSLAVTDSTMFLSSGFEILKSKDGLHWTDAGNPSILPTPTMFASGHSIMAGSVGYDGLWRSDNDGASWYRVINQGTNVSTIIRRGTTIYAATSNGTVLKSHDGGVIWMNPGNANLTPFTEVTGLAANDKYLFASVWETGQHTALYRSADSGASWQDISATVTKNFYTRIAVKGDTVVIASNPPYTAYDQVNILMSTDNGLTWTDISAGIYPLRDVMTLKYINGILFAGLEEGGIWTLGKIPQPTGVQSFPSPVAGDIRIFPNPTTGILHVASQAPVNIHVYDITGKLVREARLQQSISLEGLPASNYVAVIRDMHGRMLSTATISKQ